MPDLLDVNTVRIEVRWRPRRDAIDTRFDVAFEGELYEVTQQAVQFVGRNHTTCTIIKYSDRAEAGRFMNFSLQEVESAIADVVGVLTDCVDRTVWVDVGFQTIRIHGAGSPSSKVSLSSPIDASLCVLIRAHPMTTTHLPPAAEGSTY